MAFGQFGVVVDPAKVDVACPDDECHVAPVFMGEGGFVGELADGFDMANFVVSCGNTTASGSAAGGADGVVRELFSMANGLACHEEGGSFQIHGLADGGWYWINDDMNSAVSPLIAKDALMGDEVMPTDPGGVTLMASDYGTYVKSGSRVGILPHFVPTAPADPPPPVVEPEAATVCMPHWTGRAWAANDKDCMLGDGGTTIMMTAATADGRSSEVASVHRNPGGGADIEVHLDLWGNGSGHVSAGTNPFLGWNVPGGQGRTPEAFQATWDIDLEANDGLGTSPSDAGVSLSQGRSVPILEVVKAGRAGDGVSATAGQIDYDDDSTIEREDGYTEASLDGVPQCTQAKVMRSTDGAGGTAEYLLWAGVDGKEVAIEVDSGGQVTQGATASLEDLEMWASAHNGNTGAGYKDIKTVTVRDPGTDRVINAGDVDRQVPAVICAMGPSGKTRYVGATLSISPTTAYCNRDNNRTAVIEVEATLARTMNNMLTPKIAQVTQGVNTGRNAVAALHVHCPAE